MNRNGETTIRKRVRRFRGVDLFAVLILAVVFFVLLATGVRFVKYLVLDFAQAESNSLETLLPAEMIVIRSEYPIVAGVSGQFSVTRQEYDRVHSGDEIGYISWSQEGYVTENQTALTAPHTGLIAYHSDGWEEVLQPETLENTDWQVVLHAMAQEESAVAAATDSELQSGRVVAKVIDNLADEYLFLTATHLPADLESGDSVSLRCRVAEETLTVTARVRERSYLNNGDEYLLAVVSEEPERLYSLRHQAVEIIGGSTSGIMIPSSAVTYDKEDNTGVFCRSGRVLVFTPVEVLAVYGDITLVDGLDDLALVVTNPERAHQGQRIYNVKGK